MINLPSLYSISFILPTYNVEPYLAEAIESILQQDVDKEIIIVDDGSTDASLAVAMDYAKRYSFITVVHGQNRGVSSARNRGLALARGEFVLFLDPDDLLDPNANFGNAYRLAHMNDLDIVKGQFFSYVIGQTKIYRKPPVNPKVEGNTAVVNPLNEFMRDAALSDWLIQIACFLIKRDFLLKNQIQFDEELHFTEEGLFYADMFSCEGKILELSRDFVQYRTRLGSAMMGNNADKRIQSTLKVVQRLQERVVKQTNPVTKNGLEFVLAINTFFVHQELLDSKDENLKAKYLPLVSPEMIAFYQAKGVKQNKTETQ